MSSSHSAGPLAHVGKDSVNVHPLVTQALQLGFLDGFGSKCSILIELRLHAAVKTGGVDVFPGQEG